MIRFNATKILQTAAGPQELNVSFDVKEGSILTLYGPSGAGKTTILRMLAGLTDPTTGLIKFKDQTWFDHRHRRKKLPAAKRPIGFVFQDFALFPNFTVRQNLEYAAASKADNKLIDDLIDMMQVGELQHTRPARLSGGQQQRVALARAIVRKPQLLLLDEPLSALDDEMRHHLQDHILQAHRRFNLTTILVSHYIPEICRLSNEVICLDKGRIVGQGSPQEIFLNEYEQKNNSLKIMGELLSITGLTTSPTPQSVQASVLVANQIIQIPLTAAEAQHLQIGDKIILVPESLRLHLASAISQLP